MKIEDMDIEQLRVLAVRLEEALVESNARLMEQTEIAQAANRQAEEATAEIEVLAGSVRIITRHFNEFIEACVADDNKPHQPSKQAIAKARGYLPGQYSMSYQAAPQQHALAALSDDLPPLPEPRSIKRWESPGRVEKLHYYNEDQVREYGRMCLATRQPAPVASFSDQLHAEYAPRAIIDVAPEPFIVGNQYRTQGGRLVRFIGIANEGNSYETMFDELGHHRYTRRDFGRGTGAPWDDDCVPPLYTYPAIKPAAAPVAAAVQGDIKDPIFRDWCGRNGMWAVTRDRKAFDEAVAIGRAASKPDSERDAARIEFHLEQDTSWHAGHGKNGAGILCYGPKRKEVQAATWREAIDAAMAAQHGEKGGA